MSDDVTVLKLRGKLMYPRVFYPDTMYEHRWTVDLLLDEAGKREAMEQGLRVKMNEKNKDLFDGYDGSFVRIDRPVKDRNGNERERPTVVVYNKGMSGPRDVPSDTGIGNGTDAVVRFIVKKQDNTGKVMSPAEAQKKYGGYGMFLTGVQIVNLVPYERSSDPEMDFVEESGSFEVAETTDEGAFDWKEGDTPFDSAQTAS